jgi:molybdenum cofactor cytidylyltransferase
MTACCGVVLAGGRGERFGGPKAFATLPDGRTFLSACRDVLAAAGCDPIVATLPCGVVPPALPGVRALPLPRADLAMFDSLKIALAAALESAGWERAVVLPVDHPLVTAPTVRTLAAAGATAAIPVLAGKRGHPVVVAREVAARVVAGELGGPTLREVLHAVGVVDVAVADAGVGANCNTPAALAAAWALVRAERATR